MSEHPEEIRQLIELYVQLREKKTVLKKAYDARCKPLNDSMLDIENKMLEHMHSSGVESFKTKAGTAYLSRRTSASLGDRDTFWDYVVQHDMPELLELRASKTACQEFLEAKGELPPGVNWREEQTVNFRK